MLTCPVGVGSGQRQGACDGRHLPVWAGSEKERRAGTARSLASLLPQGGLHPLAWLQRGQYQHRPHLQTDHPWSEVWRVPEWKGGLIFGWLSFKVPAIFSDINVIHYFFPTFPRRMILFSLPQNMYTSCTAQTAVHKMWRKLFRSASTTLCWRPSLRPNGCSWSALLMLRSVTPHIRRCSVSRTALKWSWEDWMFLSIKPHQGPYLSSKQNADSVKAEMVDYAREKWPIFFSRFFEVVKLSGRCLLAKNVSSPSVVMSLNHL